MNAVPWTDRQEQQLAAMVAAGIEIARIAAAFGRTVSEIAERVGGAAPSSAEPVQASVKPPRVRKSGRHRTLAPRPAQPRRAWTPERLSRVLDLYASGLTATQIANLTGEAYSQIRRRIRETQAGDTSAIAVRPFNDWSDALRVKVTHLRAAGWTYKQIAGATGLTLPAVRSGLARMGVRKGGAS